MSDPDPRAELLKEIQRALDAALQHHLSGNVDGALIIYHEILSVDPNHPDALHRTGVLMHQIGDNDTAIRLIQKAITLQPGDSEYHSNLGGILEQANRLVEAKATLARALDLNPSNHVAHANLAMVLNREGAFHDALEHAERALELKPSYGLAMSELVHAATYTCAWPRTEKVFGELMAEVARALDRGDPSSIPPFRALSLPIAPDVLRRIAEGFSKRFTFGLKADAIHRHPRPHRQSGRKLRIGYLSGDFNQHAVGFLLNNLFSHHDRSSFEIFSYSLRSANDEIEKEIAASSDRYVDLSGLASDRAAARVHEDAIDILVDFGGYTTHGRPQILARRPSPVQCQYLGYPGTMGTDFVQYYFAHETLVPERLRSHFTESLVYFPETHFATRGFTIPEAPLQRSDFGLPDAGTVFACFNNPYRIDRAVFDLWVRILKRVPRSVLWLQATGGVVENLRAEAKARGLAGHRLVFSAPENMSKRWRHRLADLWLDTLTISGGTAGVLAAWAGLPVVTCTGETPQTLTGATIATEAGAPDLIVHDTEEYERLAVRLATHKDELEAHKRKLLEVRASAPLFNPRRFVLHLEEAYRMLWSLHERGERPKVVEVPKVA